MSVQSIKPLIKDLQLLIYSDPNSIQIASLLKDLKYQTSCLSYSSNSNTSSINLEELIVVRDFNELNVIYSLKIRNQAEYDNSMSRLKVTYEDSRFLLPKSQNENLLTAVYLLYLLSNNKFIYIHFISLFEIFNTEFKNIMLDLSQFL